MSTFSISRFEGVVSISLDGEFDIANVDELRANAQQALDAAGVTRIIIDLAQVTFMGSTVLGALVGIREDAVRASIEVALSNVPARAQRLLELTKLDTVFDVIIDATAKIAPVAMVEVDDRRSVDEPLGL